MNIEIRTGRPEDARPAGEICFHAFKTIADQHRFPPDFPGPQAAVELLTMLLANANVHAVVAEADGRVAGSNFLWENGLIAGIGPITVDPKLQNGRVGTRLMEAVLGRARERGFAGVRLVQAAYHGRSLSLYTKLGFDVRETLAVLQGARIGASVPGHTVRNATRADMPACNALATRVHGHDRAVELADAIGRGASVVERGGRITGYATMIGFFGHALAETNGDLAALIAATEAIAGPGLLLPMRNAELFRWCLAHGLRVVQPLTLMSMGLYNEPAGAFLPSIVY